jgi:hypothetical protein
MTAFFDWASGSGTYTLSSDDRLFILPGVNLYNAATTVTATDSSNISVQVQGAVTSNVYGVAFLTTGAKASSANLVQVGTSGSIVGGSAALYDQGTFTSLNNAGFMGSTGTRVVYGTGSFFDLQNSGTIQAGSSGVGVMLTGTFADVRNDGVISGGRGVLLDGQFAKFTNRGEVSADLSGISFSTTDGRFINSGSVSGHTNGVDFAGDNETLINTGDIAGDSYGVEFDIGNPSGIGGVTTIRNHGTIHGLTGGMVFINSVGLTTQTVDLVNRGTIAAGSVSGQSLGADVAGLTATISNFGDMLGAIGLADGNDTLTNRGLIDGFVNLGAGNDLFNGRGGTVTGFVHGGAGDDTFIVDDSTISLNENVAEGTDLVKSVVGWTLGANFENLSLIGARDASGFGNALDNVLTGNSGNNRLVGLDGADTLNGGFGDDVLRGGGGRDALHGGTGDDILRGQSGNDFMVGDNGMDTLIGNAGNDMLRGGGGNDVLVGGLGRDRLAGQADSDVFRFNQAADSPNMAGRDTILDFSQGEDVIDLSAVAPGVLSFLGTGAFTAGGQAELRVTNDGSGNGAVRVDVDGDGTADMYIAVNGIVGLTELDFIL